MLRARLRALSGWSDACILNVSSRGLMINAPCAVAAQGSTIELWHGDRMIVATVVWRRGSRAGLQAEDRVPVEEILAGSESDSLQLTATLWPDVERRRKPRTGGNGRVRARAIELAGVATIAVLLAGGACLMVKHAFARPLALVQSSLGR